MSGGITAATVFQAVGAAVGVVGLMNNKKSNPAPATQAAVAAPAPAPVVEPVEKIPTPMDTGVREAKQTSIADQMRRRGRASTILTDIESSDTLGV